MDQAGEASLDRQGDLRRGSPSSSLIRECRVQIARPGFRVQEPSSSPRRLLDADEFTKDDIAQLYRARWNAELDLKSLKQTLQMDILQACKTPENSSARSSGHAHPGLQPHPYDRGGTEPLSKHGIEPRTISFKGTLQTLEAFQPVIALQGEHNSAFRHFLYHCLLDAIAKHRVRRSGPTDLNPRLRKRRLQTLWLSQKTQAGYQTRYAERGSGNLSAIRLIDRSIGGPPCARRCRRTEAG